MPSNAAQKIANDGGRLQVLQPPGVGSTPCDRPLAAEIQRRECEDWITETAYTP
jgi:hypothetical protein